MNKEEREQWLYETYQYTSNFDFNRLDKYEEANDDVCIDDIILDYTMLYELHKEEIEVLNNIIKTKDERIDKAIKYILGNDLDNFNNINNLLNILKGSDKE